VLKQIIIRGRTYTLRADEGDDIEQVAADVDRRMREMSGRAPAFDEYTVALLTAMNLASEIHALRKRLQERVGELDRRAAAIEAVLEASVGRGADS